MNIVLFTTDEDRLGGVFADAYWASGGPELSAIVTLQQYCEPESWREKVALAKLVGVRGASQLALAKLGTRASGKWQHSGLRQRWPDSLTRDSTRVLASRMVKDESFMDELRGLSPDLIVSVGSPVIFGRELLAIPRIGAVNVHNGLLPKYRGHFGTYWEVTQGERWAYVCVHEMVARVDSGAILDWERAEVARARSFFDLMLEKKRMGGTLLARLLCEIRERGEMPPPRPLEQQEKISDDYFPFPSADEIWKFNWRNEKRRRAA